MIINHYDILGSSRLRKAIAARLRRRQAQLAQKKSISAGMWARGRRKYAKGIKSLEARGAREEAILQLMGSSRKSRKRLSRGRLYNRTAERRARKYGYNPGEDSIDIDAIMALGSV